jgi:hypothetical protein
VRPSPKYSRMFSAFAAGTFLLITGLIGWNVRNMRGLFEGGQWADGPIVWQIVLGVGFLLLGGYWSRHLGEPEWNPPSTPREQIIKHVGRGRTSDADKRRSLNS